MNKYFLNINSKSYEVPEEVYIYVKQLENPWGWSESKKELVEFKQEYICQFTDSKNMKSKPKYMSDSDWEAEMELVKELARDDYCDKVIFTENGQWYFWDESWTQKHGPFQSEDEVVDSLKRYCNYLNQ